MSDVFVSYARPDEPQAKRVADVLRAQGFSVWRDDELPAHRAYADVIQERLNASKAVVVIWSVAAAKSQWVRAEADTARQAGTLVQATLDGTIPPLPFNQIQCAELRGWSGDLGHQGWHKLLGSVAALAGGDMTEAQAAKPAARLRHSVCVLPFANMSGDVEQEYFSDGISEDITTDLSKVSALGVTARNTAFLFKGDALDVCDVASKLGVSHVLEGSVRKAGGRVRISAQLIDGATGDHVWAERYDRELTDIFAIQDEISKAIVAALKVKLLPEEKKAIEQRGTSSAEAYNLYLLARQYWISGNHGDPRREERTERVCKRAVAVDPNYARAWALMALAQATLRHSFGREMDDGVAAARRALDIDPSIAEAHCVIARHHSEAGRDEEADAEIARALELDPESWEVNKEAARLCMMRRRLPEATKHYEKATEVMDSDFHAWALLLTCYGAQGDKAKIRHAAEKMVSESQRALQLDPSNGAALGIIAGGFATLGEADRAREWIERAMLIDPDNLNMRYNFACVLARQLNDPMAALDLLEPTFAEEPAAVMIRLAMTDPDLDTLREEPRFKDMMAAARKRLGIKAPGRATAPAAAVAPLHS